MISDDTEPLGGWDEGKAVWGLGGEMTSILHVFHLRSLSPEERSSPRGSEMCNSEIQKSSQEYIRDSTTNKVTKVEVRLQRGTVDGEQGPGRHLTSEHKQRHRPQRHRAPWHCRSLW